LEQGRIHLSRIPKRCSEPGLGQLVGRVLSNGIAQERNRLLGRCSFYVVDPEPEAYALMPGFNFAAAARAWADRSNFACA